ncbi:hypothetical protein GCM10010394_27070 [Streptomyces crystallinus]|uniref:Uncharacterized protein n=1 Tax=Streptomyces crystallinus TaxID=68191 RepID=A0ABP3QVF1_9ACTN
MPGTQWEGNPASPARARPYPRTGAAAWKPCRQHRRPSASGDSEPPATIAAPATYKEAENALVCGPSAVPGGNDLIAKRTRAFPVAALRR